VCEITNAWKLDFQYIYQVYSCNLLFGNNCSIFFPAHRHLWRNIFLPFLSSSKLMLKQFLELEQCLFILNIFHVITNFHFMLYLYMHHYSNPTCLSILCGLSFWQPCSISYKQTAPNTFYLYKFLMQIFSFTLKKNILQYSNTYPTRCNLTQFIISENCSTCFGWYLHP
jgi:hypothetical protein